MYLPYHLTTFHGFCVLLTTEVVPKVFPNLNVVAHLVVPAGWGFLPQRFFVFCTVASELVCLFSES